MEEVLAVAEAESAGGKFWLLEFWFSLSSLCLCLLLFCSAFTTAFTLLVFSISFVLSHSLFLRSLVSDLSNLSSFFLHSVSSPPGFVTVQPASPVSKHSFPFVVVFMRRVMVDVLILF